MVNLKTIAGAAAVAAALAMTGLGLATGVANADTPLSHPAVTASNLNGFALDDWGYGPGYGYGGPGYGWSGQPGYGYGGYGGYGPGYGYGGGCAFIPPFVSQWIPPAACGG